MSSIQDHRRYYRRYYKLYKRLGPVKWTLFSAWGLWLLFVAMSMVMWGALLEFQNWMQVLGIGGLLWWLVLLWIGLRLWRKRYLRDAILLTSLAHLSSAALLWATGLLLIWHGGDIPPFWIQTLLMVIVLINWKNRSRKVEQWELARRKGYLKKYLDEKRWLIRYNPWEFPFLLSRAEGKYQEHIRRRRWVERLDKWTPLIPGSAMLFRRTFGHEMTVIGIALCVVGAVFMIGLQHLMLYFMLREWDRARGAALVMIEGDTKAS